MNQESASSEQSPAAADPKAGVDRISQALAFWSPLPIYLIGLLHWVLFYNFGHISFEAYDWPKEYAYYNALKEAIQEGRIPWHFAGGAKYHGTDRYLAMPEIVASPEVFLLPFLKVDEFILAHTLLLYSIGFVGCLLIRQRYQLSFIPFVIFFVLFHFNGHIVAHLASGHTMWNGYFLLPFFGLFLLEMVENKESFAPAMKLAFVLFAMMLQGSFHMVVWCWWFLLFFVLGDLQCWRQGLLVLGFSVALSLVRLLPAAAAFWNFKEYPFISGFPSLSVLLDGFTVLRLHTVDYLGGVYGSLAWGEYDFYLGVLGFGFLLWGGVWLRFARDPVLKGCQYAALDLPLAAMAVMSLTDVYALIANLPIPLANGERVPSRFLIIPVVMLLLLAAIRLQRRLESRQPSAVVNWLWMAGIVQTCFTLATHSYFWNVHQFEKEASTHWVAVARVETTARPDPIYTASVIVSVLMTGLALAVWIWLFLGFRRSARAA